MKKRFLSGLLAAVMTLGLALSAFPAIIANAATAEPIGSVSLTEKFKEGIAAYLNGETEKTWTGWQNITQLTFGSFKLDVEADAYHNITRAWANETSAGVWGKMTWENDGYVEGHSNPMNAISTNGDAIMFESGFAQYMVANYTVERDGVYNIKAAVSNSNYDTETTTNPNPDAVKFEVLVNDVLKGEATLAYGEEAVVETEIMTLKIGDVVTLRTIRAEEDTKGGHWKYKLNAAAKLQVFEDLTPADPIAKYNLADEMRTAFTSDSYTVNNSIKENKFGPYYFKLTYGNDVAFSTFSGNKWSAVSSNGTERYIDAWSGTYGSPRIVVNTNTASWDGFALSAQNSAYTNWKITAVFVAPKDGVYNFVPKASKPAGSAWTNNKEGATYSVTVNGEAQLMDGTNTEMSLVYNSAGNLPVIEDISLKAGNTIEVTITKPMFSGSDWGYSYVGANFDIDLVEDLSNSLETYNVADSLRTFLSTEPADKTYANAYFGNFKFDYAFRASYATQTYGYATTGTEYQLIPTTYYEKPYIGVAADAATCAGIKIRGNYYNQENAISFVAPKDGIYTISDAVAYAGKSSLFNSNFDGKMTLKVLVNGVAQNISEEADPTVLILGQLSTANMPDLGYITLKEGDTIQFLVYTNQTGWNERLAFVNFNVNLIKDLTPPAALESWNLYDEFSSNLATLAADGTDYVGTQISALNLGAFKLVPGSYYTLVKNLSATAIGGKATDGNNCHDILTFSNDNVGIHTCYTNPVTITFTAPKAGAYVIDLSDELTIDGTTLAQTAFEVLVNGESVAKYTAAGAMSDIEVDLNKNDTVVLKVTTGIDSSNWARTRAIFDCTINLLEETPVFASANIALSDDITIKFAVNKSWFTDKGYSNPMVRYELEDRVVEVTEYEEATINGTLRYRFALTGVGPQTMADDIKATLIATNAEGKRFAYETREYSVKTYCMNQITSTKTSVTQEFKAFCVNTLNYGAASQIYTGHNTDNLANADLTEEQASWAVGERAEYKDTIETGAKDGIVVWKSANMLFGSSVSMQFKFQTAADMTGCYVEVNGVRVADENLTYNADDDRYVIKYTDLRPDQFSKRINVVVKDANGTEISPVLGYDMETYVARVKGADMKELGKKVIAYGDAAEIYAKSKN